MRRVGAMLWPIGVGLLSGAFIVLAVIEPGDRVCEVAGGLEEDWSIDAVAERAARACRRGWTLVVRPPVWGNEQFPINIAGRLCDLQREVVWNKAGVVCRYRPSRVSAP